LVKNLFFLDGNYISTKEKKLYVCDSSGKCENGVYSYGYYIDTENKPKLIYCNGSNECVGNNDFKHGYYFNEHNSKKNDVIVCHESCVEKNSSNEDIAKSDCNDNNYKVIYQSSNFKYCNKSELISLPTDDKKYYYTVESVLDGSINYPTLFLSDSASTDEIIIEVSKYTVRQYNKEDGNKKNFFYY